MRAITRDRRCRAELLRRAIYIHLWIFKFAQNKNKSASINIVLHVLFPFHFLAHCGCASEESIRVCPSLPLVRDPRRMVHDENKIHVPISHIEIGKKRSA